MAGARGDLCGSRTAKNVPLEHALWIYEGAGSTGKGQRVPGEGDTYFGIFQGGRVYGVEESMPISSTVSASPSARVGSTGVFLSCRAFPGKIVEKPILRAGLLDACLLEGRGKSASETPPRSAFGRGIRCRNPLSWKIRRG